MKNNKIYIYCDGGSRGNPGPSASAFVIKKNEKEIYSQSKYLGIATNNIAEYNAVAIALHWLTQNKEYLSEKIFFVLDSELVVKQINGEYKIKNQKLKDIYLQISKLLKQFENKIVFENVSREKNKKADLLVNQELNKQL